jgi:hypothetical protein
MHLEILTLRDSITTGRRDKSQVFPSDSRRLATLGHHHHAFPKLARIAPACRFAEMVAVVAPSSPPASEYVQMAPNAQTPVRSCPCRSCRDKYNPAGAQQVRNRSTRCHVFDPPRAEGEDGHSTDCDYEIWDHTDIVNQNCDALHLARAPNSVIPTECR